MTTTGGDPYVSVSVLARSMVAGRAGKAAALLKSRVSQRLALLTASSAEIVRASLDTAREATRKVPAIATPTMLRTASPTIISTRVNPRCPHPDRPLRAGEGKIADLTTGP